MIAGQKVDFTYRYIPGERWIGVDYHVEVISTA
jgi:hypothetical protein